MGIPENHPGIEAARRNGLLPPAAAKPGPARPPVPRAVLPPRLVLEVDCDCFAASEANASRRGGVRARAARKRAVEQAVRAALPAALAGHVPLPCVVTLTRLGTRELDGDNLHTALKWVRDVVAAWIGVDDRDRRVTWRVKQVASWTPGVRVRVEYKGACAT